MSELMKLDKRGCFLGQVDPDAYHAQKSKFTVSKSMLHEFDESPAKWKYMKDRGIRRESSGFGFGSLLDCLLLTPELFAEKYVVSPYTEFRSNEAKAWKKQAETEGKSIVKQSDIGEAAEAVENLSQYMEKEFGLVLGKTYVSQVAWAARLASIEGIRLTATGMIDMMPTEGSGLEDWLFDVKTIGRNIDDETRLAYDFMDYGYHWQAGMYRDGVNMVKGDEQIKHFGFFCVESVAPYRVKFVVAHADDLMVGSAEWQRAAARYAHCLATDEWPGLVLPKLQAIIPPYKLRAWKGEDAV